MDYTFAINAPSDLAADSHIWRDAWVKEALTRALSSDGYEYSFTNPDINIWIWGWINRPILPGPSNILWIVGHPELLEKHLEEIRAITWRGIFCSSRSYTKKLKDQGIEVEFLLCPPPIRRSFTHKPSYEVAFVGNADPKKGRGSLIPVFSRYESHVIGNFPNANLHEISWDGMQEVWNSAKIVPYTHHIDMSREGFAAESAMDTMINSGALLLSDKNSGWEDLNIPAMQWSTEEELYEMINFYLKNEKERVKMVTKCRVAAAKYNYKYCATQMEKCF
jgi:hypothetical protein